MGVPTPSMTPENQMETSFMEASVVENKDLKAVDSHITDIGDVVTIKTFLKRPVQIWSSRLTSSSPVIKGLPALGNDYQMPVKSFTFPRDAMTMARKEKLNYYRWFRTDVVVKVELSANPFVAGKVFVTLSPNDRLRVDSQRIYRKGRRGLTSYQSLEIDIREATSGEMRIPWCSRAEALDLNVYEPTDWDAACVDIWLLTPVEVATNSPDASIGIQVFCWLENVDLRMPTPLRAVYQGKRETPGPIQQVSSGIKNVSSKLEKLPVVGTVASTVSWASDLVGGVASIFGWSRPNDSSKSIVVPVPAHGFNNFVSSDNSVVLGMSSENSIAEQDNNASEDVDEMSVDYICARPGVVGVFPWKTSDPPGNLFTVMNGPGMYEETIPGVVPVACDSTCGDYLINKFRLYRADTHFRISIAKTQFHVGRLEIFWSPVGNIDDTSNAYREIVDITNRSEIHFTIPFISRTVMRYAYNGLEDAEYGRLYVRVLTPLNAPETVSQTVNIVVWKHYTNVALSGPLGFSWPLYVRPTDAKKQGDKPNDFICFGNENDFDTNLSATKTVGGEMCVSLRQATRGFRRTLVDKPVWKTNLSNDHGGYLAVCNNLFSFYRGGLSFKFVARTPVLQSVLDDNTNSQVTLFSQRHLPSHFTVTNTTPIHEVTVPYYSTYRRAVTDEDIDPLVNTQFPNLRLFSDEKYTPVTTEDSPVTFVAAKDDFNCSFLIGPPVVVAQFG